MNESGFYFFQLQDNKFIDFFKQIAIAFEPKKNQFYIISMYRSICTYALLDRVQFYIYFLFRMSYSVRKSAFEEEKNTKVYGKNQF